MTPAPMILQTRLPYDIADARLPGTAPLDPAQWLLVDEAYAPQMAERARLLATRRDEVLFCAPWAREAALELQDEVQAHLPPAFTRDGSAVICPDGRRWQADPDDPMGALGLLVQQDLCLMIKRGDEHVLGAAVLCFPAGWRLAEKAARPLTAIHAPVTAYDAPLAARVQRLFDGVRPGRPLWRFNALWYDDPTLFQPHMPLGRRRPAPDEAGFLRSERQVVLRLPQSGAVVFSIHTFVLRHRATA